MNLSQTHLRRVVVICLLVTSCDGAWAQVDTSDRLWRGTEQQLRQIERQAAPAPLEEGSPGASGEAALPAPEVPPIAHLQQLMFVILNAVNGRDWVSVDHWLREYAQVPQHDPSLFDFVAASRAAAAGDYADAIAGYSKVLETNPQFARGTLDLASALYADNRLRDAQEIFQRLRQQPLPPQVIQHIDDYLGALKRRRRMQLSLSISAVHEDNVNRASTVVDPCALIFFGACLPNDPGERIGAYGAAFEGSFNKLWPLKGNHGVLLRGIGYGNHYEDRDDYDNLTSTTYVGYQYASARSQLQILPLFEYDREGKSEAYHAFGLRTSFGWLLNARTQLEASYEYKDRDFTDALDYLRGDVHSLSLFTNYAVRNSLVLYGGLIWRDSDALLPIFAYRERVARIGIYKSFEGQATLNLSYAYRLNEAQASNGFFGERQRDHENSVYLNLTAPRLAWQGVTPTLSYEFRDNRSSIAYAYNFEKSRVTLGFNKIF